MEGALSYGSPGGLIEYLAVLLGVFLALLMFLGVAYALAKVVGLK